jgi:hypothetical protein
MERGAITEFGDPVTLQEHDLPALYQSADRNSLEAQQEFLKRTRTGLIALLVAAAAGAFTLQVEAIGTADLMGIIAAVAFGVALLMRFYLLKDRSERIWYDGRAVAESAKTLAWRYSVGAVPFGGLPELRGDVATSCGGYAERTP